RTQEDAAALAGDALGSPLLTALSLCDAAQKRFSVAWKERQVAHWESGPRGPRTAAILAELMAIEGASAESKRFQLHNRPGFAPELSGPLQQNANRVIYGETMFRSGHGQGLDYRQVDPVAIGATSETGEFVRVTFKTVGHKVAETACR